MLHSDWEAGHLGPAPEFFPAPLFMLNPEVNESESRS